MAKPPVQFDVFVLGDHPCTYLAAAILRQKGDLRVGVCRIPNQKLVDRLVVLNPAFFELHPLLTPVKRRLDLLGTYGLKFMADDPATSSTSIGKTIGAYIGSLKQIQTEMQKLAKKAGVAIYSPKLMRLETFDESGAQLVLDSTAICAKLLLLGGTLPPEQLKVIGLGEPWDPQTVHRYTFLKLKTSGCYEAGNRPVITMSLNLGGEHRWAWLLPGQGYFQLAVEQTIDGEIDPNTLMKRWIDVLISHGVLTPGAAKIDVEQSVKIELPLAGALSQESVANRTLCIGPAGGFYSACAEDVYPNCWSAACAADVAVKALRERHLQDALHAYRQNWGATLGDYLRGPHQNLRFLLPLVYRNPTMAARLADAILKGKSVVR